MDNDNVQIHDLTISKKRKHSSNEDEEDEFKFQEFMQMTEILLPVGTFNAQEELIQLEPPVFTDDITEATKTCSSTKALSRKMINALQSRVNGPDGRSRDYIFQAIELPILGQAIISYLLSSIFTPPMNTSIEGYKNTFNIFAFLPPPINKAYDDHILMCNKNTADDVIGQSDHSAAPIKRTTFINGRQKTLSDVLATIGNLFIFFKCIVNFDREHLPIIHLSPLYFGKHNR